jgi:Tfp pilus assembly protein PilO
MDRNRLMMIAAVLAAFVVLAGGFFLGVQPQLKSAADAHSAEVAVTAQNEKLASTLASLRAQYSKLGTKKADLADLRKTVPAGVDSGSMITELNGIAEKSGVTLSNIQFGTAASYMPPVSAAAPATATAGATASPSPSATASPTPVASTPVAPAVTTDPLITAANFSTIPLTVTIQGSYADALSFLQGVRDADRLFMINTITSAAGTSASGDSTTDAANAAPDTLNWTFGGLVYALTDAKSAQQSQQNSSSTTAGSTTADGSSTDTAAGK